MFKTALPLSLLLLLAVAPEASANKAKSAAKKLSPKQKVLKNSIRYQKAIGSELVALKGNKLRSSIPKANHVIQAYTTREAKNGASVTTFFAGATIEHGKATSHTGGKIIEKNYASAYAGVGFGVGATIGLKSKGIQHGAEKLPVLEAVVDYTFGAATNGITKRPLYSPGSLQIASGPVYTYTRSKLGLDTKILVGPRLNVTTPGKTTNSKLLNLLNKAQSLTVLAEKHSNNGDVKEANATFRQIKSLHKEIKTEKAAAYRRSVKEASYVK